MNDYVDTLVVQLETRLTEIRCGLWELQKEEVAVANQLAITRDILARHPVEVDDEPV